MHPKAALCCLLVALIAALAGAQPGAVAAQPAAAAPLQQQQQQPNVAAAAPVAAAPAPAAAAPGTAAAAAAADSQAAAALQALASRNNATAAASAAQPSDAAAVGPAQAPAATALATPQPPAAGAALGATPLPPIPVFPPSPPSSGVSSAGRTDGSDELLVPLIPGALERLQQILAGVVANSSRVSTTSLTSKGQDTAAAEAGGFVVRRGTQFFKDGSPFYFVGSNAYWFVDFYTLDWSREKIEEFLDTCQRLGVSVIRTWMFNLGMPKAFARYDARQVAGMDYVIWAAKRRGLLLTLTLGNLWNAYRGPEDFLLMATGDIAGKDILDFYADPNARALYKLHVWGLLSRSNPLTGLAPRDDPTIFSFNVINEPRCPGCFTPAQQAVHQDWLRDVAAFTRAVTPRHLISASTEGFFVQDARTMLHWYNPGPGAQCDGEDWFAISALPYFDYTTIHVYERHMELLPRPSANPNWPNWDNCGWSCYVNWFRMYNQLHAYLAANVLKKPLVLEEFGLTWFKKTLDQQRVLFQVASDMLLDSARNGGSLAGMMFWNGAHNDTVDWDGYNVPLDRPAFTRAGSALPSPSVLPASVVTHAQAVAMTPNNWTRPIPPDVVFNSSGAPPALAAQMNVKRPTVTRPPPATATATAAQQALAPPLPGALPAAVGPAAGAAATRPAGAVAPAANASAAALRAAANATSAAAQPVAQPAAQQRVTTGPQPSRLAASTIITPAAQPASATQVVGRRLLGRLQDNGANVGAQHHSSHALLDLAAHTVELLRQVGAAADAPPAVLRSIWPDAAAVEPGTGSASHARFSSSAAGAATSPWSPAAALSTPPPAQRRRLLVLEDELDAFRRGPIRAECAELSARTWRPYNLFNISDTITANPRYQAVLAGGNVVGVISDTTAKLNALRQAAAAPAPAQPAIAGG